MFVIVNSTKIFEVLNTLPASGWGWQEADPFAILRNYTNHASPTAPLNLRHEKAILHHSVVKFPNLDVSTSCFATTLMHPYTLHT